MPISHIYLNRHKRILYVSLNFNEIILVEMFQNGWDSNLNWLWYMDWLIADEYYDYNNFLTQIYTNQIFIPKLSFFIDFPS